MRSSVRRFPNKKGTIKIEEKPTTLSTKEELKFKKEYIERYGYEAWVKNYGKEYIYLEDTSLEGIAWALMQLRRKNRLEYYAIWNGHYLYSYNVTYDHAFREIYGISRTAYLKRLKEETTILKLKK